MQWPNIIGDRNIHSRDVRSTIVDMLVYMVYGIQVREPAVASAGHELAGISFVLKSESLGADQPSGATTKPSLWGLQGWHFNGCYAHIYFV